MKRAFLLKKEPWPLIQFQREELSLGWIHPFFLAFCSIVLLSDAPAWNLVKRLLYDQPIWSFSSVTIPHGSLGGFHSIQNTQWTSMITSFCLSFSKSISRNQKYILRQARILSSLAKDESDPCTLCGNNTPSRWVQDFADTWYSEITIHLQEFKGTGLSRNINSQLFKHHLYL